MKKESSQILPVVVLYNQSFLESITFQTLLSKMTDNIFVYDNSQKAQEINLTNVYYYHNPNNSGLSSAYNSAASFARENGYKWLLLLDQDTDFSEVKIEDYQNAINANPDIKMFAPKVKSGALYMSPTNVRHKYARLRSSVPTGLIDLRKYGVINSGMCLNVESMLACGGYKEEVFLDYSDFQFLDRFKRLYPTGFIMDCEARQDLSVFSDNKESSLKRFELFCRSIKACERHSTSDNYWFLFVVMKRCVSISLRLKSLKPYRILYTYYLK